MRNFTEQQKIRKEKLEKLISMGINPYFNQFYPDINSKKLNEKYHSFTKEQLVENPTNEYKVYGRIMMLRDQGKAAFLSLKDQEGNIQVYLKQEELNPQDFEVFKLLDLGDVIGVSGKIMKTNSGEVTVRANHLTILAKAITPLPDKFKGLEDIEEIYRRRYLDLIVNDKSRNTFKTRSEIIFELRNFLHNKGFMEVETPILTTLVSGAAARPFRTYHNALDIPLSLRIATELPLKRLLVGGFEKVYEIGRIFRNEGISIRHNPEFTSIELYELNSDVNGMIKITEEIFSHLSLKILGKQEVEYGDYKISLKPPFKKIEMTDLVKEVTGVDFNKINSFQEAKEAAKKHGIEIQKHWDSKGYVLNAFFEEKGESHLIQPTFVTGYPKEVSPLAKMRPGSKELTDRFELFIGKREYANGFSELNDSQDQYERFLSQVKEKESGNDEATDMDIDYIEALEYGLASSGGLGIGIDRLVMLLTNSVSIRDVILFPTQKPR